MSGKASTPVRVMSALAILGPVEQVILPAHRAAGGVAEISWDPTTVLIKRIAAGERADVICAIVGALDGLERDGVIDGPSRLPVAQAVLGIAVRAGAPRPDISTTEKFRAALLAAPSIAMSRAGASGIYFEQLIDRLGIGAEIRTRLKVIPAGLTGELAADGRAAIAVQQLSELMAVPEFDVVGPLPAEIGSTTDFDVALFKGAGNLAAARRFIDALRSPEARRAYAAAGLVPLF